MPKDIQIRHLDDNNEWESLYPLTKTRIVEDDAGVALPTLLGGKINRNEVYTSVEIDNKLSAIQEDINAFEPFKLPVTNEEPEDGTVWFETL